MANLLPNIIQQFRDSNGLPLAGGKLYSYVAGTSTPQATYTDQSEGTPNANPTILDASGQAAIWIGNGKSYKLVLQDSAGVVIATVDNVVWIGNGYISTLMLADGSVTTAKIADLAVTTAKIADAAVTTPKIADGAVTAPKIPDGSLPIAKFASAASVVMNDVSDPLFGVGPSLYPKLSWASPTLISNPASPPASTGTSVAWSPSGKMLLMTVSGAETAILFKRFSTNLVRMSPGIKGLPGEDGLGATSNGCSSTWSPGGNGLAIAATSGACAIYQRQGGVYVLDKYAGPAVGSPAGCAWSPDGDYVAGVGDTSPFVKIAKRTDIYPNYAVSRYESNSAQSVTSGTSFRINFEDQVEDNLSLVQTGAGAWQYQARRKGRLKINARIKFDFSTAWSVNEMAQMWVYKNNVLHSLLDLKTMDATVGSGNYYMSLGGEAEVPVTFDDSIWIIVTQTSGSSLPLTSSATDNFVEIREVPAFDSLSEFTILSNPGSLPAGAAKCVAWSPDSQFLAVGHATSPFITVYQRTGDTFAKVSDPASLPAAQVNGIAWSPDGMILACAVNASPYLKLYTRSGTTLTAIANPASLPAGQANGVHWSPDGKYLAIAHATSPYLDVYVTGGTFGANGVLTIPELDLV